jgi:hypothetical protein
MSIWKELLEKGGAEELNKWLMDQPDVVQDDILFMINQLVSYLEDSVSYLEDSTDPRVKYGPNYQPLEEDSKVPKKPKLYLVKK